MFLSPQNSHVEILTPPGHDIRGGSWLNQSVRAFVVALMLLKRDPRDLLWDPTGREHHLLPHKWAGPHQTPNLPVSISDSSASRTLRNKFLFTDYPVCAFFVTGAWTATVILYFLLCMRTMTDTHLQRWVCGLNEANVSKAPTMVSGTKDSKYPCTPWPLMAHLRIRCLEIPAVGITQALIGPFTTGIKWTITLNWCPKNNQ